MSTEAERAAFPAEVVALMDEARAVFGLVFPWQTKAGRWLVSIENLKGGLAGELFERLKTTPGWNLYSPSVLVWGWEKTP